MHARLATTPGRAVKAGPQGAGAARSSVAARLLPGRHCMGDGHASLCWLGLSSPNRLLSDGRGASACATATACTCSTQVGGSLAREQCLRHRRAFSVMYPLPVDTSWPTSDTMRAPAKSAAASPLSSHCSDSRVTCVPPTAHAPATAGGAGRSTWLSAAVPPPASPALGATALVSLFSGACPALSWQGLPWLLLLGSRASSKLPADVTGEAATAAAGASVATGSCAHASCCQGVRVRHCRLRGVRGCSGSGWPVLLPATNSRSTNTCISVGRTSVAIVCGSLRPQMHLALHVNATDW